MVAVLHGAVVGGGLEIAAACHIRVAEASAYYALPEGSRGIFVGGGGAVRLPRLIGTARMTDMMLTGRSYSAEEGQAIGISHYLVPAGAGLAKGIELAKQVAGNAPMTNFAVTHVLPRIAAADPAAGYLTEALISAIAQGDAEAKARLKAFLEKRAAKTAARAWSIVALAVFAVSALHLSHREGATESWFIELAGHHASVPLIFAILYQDFRFALADLFLKRALALSRKTNPLCPGPPSLPGAWRPPR